SEEDFEHNIPKWTFSFGQAPVVIINRNETIDIYHGYAFDEEHPQWLQKIDTNFLEYFGIDNLILGKTWEKLYERYFKNTPTVDKYLLKNIIDARRLLIAKDVGGLSAKAANRLIGRLLFIRYLIDRDVRFSKEPDIQGEDIAQRRKSLLALLQNQEETYQFFHSLTNKFNGDLFPLIEKDKKGKIIYDEANDVRHTPHLDIIRDLFSGSQFSLNWGKTHGYTVQRSLFEMYDFAVIPVELISNIYENFLGEAAKKAENQPRNLRDFPQAKQKQIKAYYTPPFLVDYILAQTVTPHLEQQDSASCKVLDPACGSGIFLVETLRKIIAKEMQVHPVTGAEGKPTILNERLWELVHENIFGIDIDSDAIEIAIFSLYITLLDYKTPIEIEEFNFDKLKGINFFGG
ncbi:MAG: N-6 DNA methylase, partial [Deltaproteobacteria bacterium]|nr:N-6 DNA methylase [Deltaproteobacteria bacterium]